MRSNNFRNSSCYLSISEMALINPPLNKVLPKGGIPRIDKRRQEQHYNNAEARGTRAQTRWKFKDQTADDLTRLAYYIGDYMRNRGRDGYPSKCLGNEELSQFYPELGSVELSTAPAGGKSIRVFEDRHGIHGFPVQECPSALYESAATELGTLLTILPDMRATPEAFRAITQRIAELQRVIVETDRNRHELKKRIAGAKKPPMAGRIYGDEEGFPALGGR